MVLEESGEGSDFSAGTLCQELAGSRWREIVTHKTSHSLSKRVPVGGLCVKSRKYCRAGKNLPQKLTQRRTQASSPTCWDWVACSPLVPLLKKGPQGQLCRHEEQATQSLSVSIWCSQKSAKLLCCPRPLTLGALQHSFSLGRRSSGLDPFLPQLCPVQGG